MIFVTVGTQLPFDRLIGAIDQWARANPAIEVIAQTGESRLSTHNITTHRRVDAAEFRELVMRSRLLVAHAGMGSILTALELGTPVIVMPRRSDLGEHRNDHQMATVEQLSHLGNLRVARDRDELVAALEAVLSTAPCGAVAERSDSGSDELLDTLRAFISATSEAEISGQVDSAGRPSDAAA